MIKNSNIRSITAKLLNLSLKQGIDYNRLATVFLLERLLVRLLTDTHLEKCLVFKGGYVGLRVYNSSRYTVDLDALLINSDITLTLQRSVKAIEQDIDDGTWFIFDSQINLKTQGEYGGIRQIFRAGIGEIPKNIQRAQLIHFDVGIGDPITPKPISSHIVEMLSEHELSWQVYPLETIIAEKLHTLIDRGNGNSRSKDIFDLYFYLPKANYSILKEAITHCFNFRKTTIPANPIDFISRINPYLIKANWKDAVVSIKNPPTFDEAFNVILQELTKVFPQKT